jgi:GSH-dependent disulfide-bond oxidoreductase
VVTLSASGTVATGLFGSLQIKQNRFRKIHRAVGASSASGMHYKKWWCVRLEVVVNVHLAVHSKVKAMLKFYYVPAPNPAKVALCLEELGLPYEAVPIDTRKGEQFAPAYRALNPNSKVPSLEDGDVKVFDSNAILLYLAEKTGRFLPASTPGARGELLSWLMFVATGVGPYSGQAVHFKHYAPEPKEYPRKRYDFEAERHWGILEERLGKQRYVVGDAYTIVDMAVWGWARAIPFIFGDGAWNSRPNLKRHLDEINARPAAARVEALKERFKFKTENDEESRRFLFPTLAAMAAKA